MKKFALLVLITFFAFQTDCFAATKASTQCDYKDLAELNKLAYSVKASYDFKYDKDGNVSFEITVYNVTEGIYVIIESKNKDHSFYQVVTPGSTRGGTYTFPVDNTTDIIEYSITVSSDRDTCTKNLRTFSVIKPKRNPYHDLDMCKYSGMETYHYCAEWIQAEFTISKQDIERKIETELSKFKTTAKTRCVSCEKESALAEAIKAFKEKKYFVIKVLVIAIVINILVIIFLIRRIKRYEI